MRLGIDASNLRQGGGVTHLVELLRAADPSAHGFDEVLVWGGKDTLGRIEERHWLTKIHQPQLDRGLLSRSLWQKKRLSKLARAASCEVLLVPGGSYAGDFLPVVAMSRNLLPFEWRELRRYGLSWMTLKLMLLRMSQSVTFRNVTGLIFLTKYAHDIVMKVIRNTSAVKVIIPHGISETFFQIPRLQRPIAEYSSESPFRILYVSMIDVYKHQWNTAVASVALRRKGFPVRLDLVGPAYPPALRRLRETLERLDPEREIVRYVGEVSHDELPVRYGQADMCVFASSCENMPNILLEGMASGLPIACSRRGPMPEILGDDGGIYFNPEDPKDIEVAIQTLIEEPAIRERLALKAYEKARAYSWNQCAWNTFAFLEKIASLKNEQRY